MLRARFLAPLFLFTALTAFAQPKAGPVNIMKSADIKPGMKATAWTVFEGTQPEEIPIEIIGAWKNAWGPKQDIILGKMGGKAARTNVAGGMSGSPVYVDGKLIGAVALRLSVFSPDAICGITPIELMLEINDYDKTVPSDAKLPEKVKVRAATGPMPNDLVARVMAGSGDRLEESPIMVPIETPLMFSGFTEDTMRQFSALFNQLGIKPVFGGAAGAVYETKPASNWKNALQPGQPVAGVLVSGDMSVTGLGTVSYNDGKRVLAFGHPFFNLGPVEMPMSQGEILMVLASAFQPNKIGNATEIVGALKQDRHSGIMGVLGEQAKMIPVNVKLRNFAGDGKVAKEKSLRYNVFEHQKWTPYLMMLTMFNSISGVNDFSEEVTYRLNGKVEFDGLPSMSVQTMQAPGEGPVPPPVQLAGFWGERITRLFNNQTALPKVKSAEVTIDLLPERRIAQVESGWLSQSEAAPGDTIKIKVFLRPYRGGRVERELQLKIPEGMPKGEHRIFLSDGDSLNNSQRNVVNTNRFLGLNDAVSLINQERRNTTLYASLMQQRPTVYTEDKTLPNLPQSVINVMQTGRTNNRQLSTSPDTVMAQSSVPFDFIVAGNHSLKIIVR